MDAIVEGSVIHQGNRVRVHAQLIRGATDEHFWSETYDRDLGDTLAMEGEVAQSIARRVEVTFTGAEQARLVAARGWPRKSMKIPERTVRQGQQPHGRGKEHCLL